MSCIIPEFRRKHLVMSSLLSAAGCVFASLVKTEAIEGAFGELRLREDTFRPVLQFGVRGNAPTKDTDDSGWGLEFRSEVLSRLEG